MYSTIIFHLPQICDFFKSFSLKAQVVTLTLNTICATSSLEKPDGGRSDERQCSLLYVALPLVEFSQFSEIIK